MSFVGTYAKAFGQIYISDDAFLVAVATVQNVMNGTARSQSKMANNASYFIGPHTFRIMWGAIVDRLGYRVGLQYVLC